MTFSQPTLAAELEARCVPVWVNKKPGPWRAGQTNEHYPRATLEAYPLGGGVQNVVFTFATPEGVVLTSVPGVLDADEVRAELEAATRIAREPARSGELHAQRARSSRSWAGRLAHVRVAAAKDLTLDGIRDGWFDDLEPGDGQD